MYLQRPYIEDVLEVIREIQLISSRESIPFSFSALRKKAVQEVAYRELNKGRYKDYNSAEKSIHDACSRRLKVNSIDDFDLAIEHWMSGDSTDLIKVLNPQAMNIEIKNVMESLLNSIRDKSVTPNAVDINEPTDKVRIKVETYRILRDTVLSRDIKKSHKCKCQICNQTLMIDKNTPYAEAHHIKPLGNPHNGPDLSDNIICVCPNCHVLLDYGGNKLDLIQLNLTSERKISKKYIDYHNNNIFNNIELKG